MQKSQQSTSASYGQLVIGPPGSGKTTFCNGMQQLINAVDRRNCCVVNLDPANDFLPYDCDVNIKDLVTVEDVAKSLNLGPNGALIYCMEYLESNQDWLQKQLKKDPEKNYFIFDCPGQIELYTNHNSLKNVIQWLITEQGIHLTATNLVDSHYCSDPNKFISVLMTSLATMIHMELPLVHILSKMDLAEKNGKFSFNLEYYTEVLDLSKLLDSIPDTKFSKKFKSLNKKICEVVEDYSLVSFIPLHVENKESMLSALDKIDRANGYSLAGGAGEERNMQKLLSVAVGADFQFNKTSTMQENYLS